MKRLIPLLVSVGVATLLWLAPANPVLARWLIEPGRIAVVAGTLDRGLLLHAQPNATSEVVALLPEGTQVTISGDPVWDGHGNYYPVTHALGPSGWAFDLYLAEGDISIFASGFSILARITAYSDGPEGGAIGFITRSGTVTRWGVVAVDPSVIPLGSRLLIAGMPGVYQAEDTGSGVIGNWVDVWLPTPEEARNFGSYEPVMVTVLGW